MKALVKDKPQKGIILNDVPIPEMKDDEVLIRITSAGICGTDVHIYDWDEWSRNRIKPPLIIGHEFVGEITALGKLVSHLHIGQRVSAEGHITCGRCALCRTGQAHICRDVEIIGVDRDGCFAEYMAMNAGNLWPVHDAIPDSIAALFDPVGNAMHTVMAEPVAGKSLLVTGAGAIGLFAVAIARKAGASSIMVIEPNKFKRELALKVGADKVFDPSDTTIDEAVDNETEGMGAHILLEMSGHPQAINRGFGLLRNGGCACLLGIPPGKVTLNWARDIIFKGITIRAINGRRMFDTWFQTQDFLIKNQKAVKQLITHQLPFEKFQHGFDLLHEGKAVKVVLEVK